MASEYLRDSALENKRGPYRLGNGLTVAAREPESILGVDGMRPIGREAEIAQTESFLDGRGPGPAVLLLEGEAGSGKTTLLEYGRAAAAERGYQVLATVSVETETALAYSGLADLLESIPAALIDALPGPQRHAVRHAVLRLEASPDPVDPLTTAMGVRALLRALAADGLVVLVIDDLPWLDVPSARVLSFVVRRMQDEPLKLLAAVRTSWPADQVPAVLDGVPVDRLGRVGVGPLSLGALREILRSRLDLIPGRSELVRLHEVCGGNPLFALELVQRVQRVQGGVSRALFGLPGASVSLQRLVLGRITALPSGPRDVLLVAALATDPALPVICAAARQPAAAQADLEEGIRAGLIAVTDRAVIFTHPVIRSVIVGDTAPEERRAAHHRLATVVPSPEAHARHLALGARAPDEHVAGLVEAAARVGAHRGACDIAGDLADLAVAVTPLAQAAARQRRTMLAAEQRFASRDPERARSLFEDILGDVPAGPDRAELLRRLARYRAFSGEPLTAWADTLTEALAHAGQDPGLRAAIQLDQAVVYSNLGDQAAALGCGLQAMEAAQRAGDGPVVGQCSAGLAYLAFVNGQGLRADLVGLARDSAPPPRWLSMEKRPNLSVGHVLHWAGDLSGARSCYGDEYDRAVAEGLETSLPLVLWAMVENEAWAGDWARAEQLAAEGYGLAEDSGSPGQIAFMAAVRALVHAYRGRLNPARQDAAHAVELAQGLGLPMVAMTAAQAYGAAALSVGDAAGAHRDLEPFAATVRAAGITEPSLCRFVPDEIEALARLRQLDAAHSLLGSFESRSAELRRDWGVATAARCRGLLLAAAGDVDGAVRALEPALALVRTLDLPFEVARTLLIAGEVYRRARRKQRAAAVLREARQMFADLGAPLWVVRADGELGRVGIRGPRPDAGPTLTGAEQQVAELVLAGRTNAEIAAELFMGQRTVEAHLSRAYRKFGVRSRTELCQKLPRPSPAAD